MEIARLKYDLKKIQDYKIDHMTQIQSVEDKKGKDYLQFDTFLIQHTLIKGIFRGILP